MSTNRVRTADASTALRQILSEKAQTAAGTNTLVSKDEARGMDPVLQRADEALRTEGGKGTRVKVDSLVERATADSEKTWGQFNANNTGRDGVWLSNAEVQQIKQADPALGALTELAMLRVRGRGTPTPTDPVAAIKTALTGLDFDAVRLNGFPGATRLDVRPGRPDRASVPAATLASFDHFYRAEQADWATVRLSAGKVGGQDVHLLYMTTDGDEQFLEVTSKTGEPLASARRWEDGTIIWDPFFGRDKLTETIFNLDGAGYEDGMSEPAERAAAGQIPSNWRGDVFVDSGVIKHDQGRITDLELPAMAAMTDAQKQLATAGLELAFARALKHRRTPGDPTLDLKQMGTLSIGSYTRPTDGQTYEVAYWKDIDDDTQAFYFQRNQAGDLVYKTHQYDN